jgi:hypothetical protein
MAGNPVETEQCGSAMNPPIQRVASHLIQKVVEFGADFPLNTERYSRYCHPQNGQHLQRLQSRWSWKVTP